MSEGHAAAVTVAAVHIYAMAVEVALSDGHSLCAPLRRLPALARATSSQLANWMLGNDGTGLFWPELGVAVSLEELRTLDRRLP